MLDGLRDLFLSALRGEENADVLVRKWNVEVKAIQEIYDKARDGERISTQPEREDYTEMKREFIRMASYIDVLLECSDEQRETLIGFISRLAEFMPWTERD